MSRGAATRSPSPSSGRTCPRHCGASPSPSRWPTSSASSGRSGHGASRRKGGCYTAARAARSRPPVQREDSSVPPVALPPLEHVRGHCGGPPAVNDVSFAVQAAEIVGLIGPNGAGKTTLFNLITRLYKPDGGSIVFDGEDLLRLPPHRIVSLGIART